MGKKKQENKIKELDEIEIFDLDNEYFFNEDSLSILRKNYGDRIDTIPGCLELLGSLILLNNGEIPFKGDYLLVSNRVENLISDTEEKGIDVSEFRKVYNSLSETRYSYDSNMGNSSFDNENFSEISGEIEFQRRNKIEKAEFGSSRRLAKKSNIRIAQDTLDPKSFNFHSRDEIYE